MIWYTVKPMAHKPLQDITLPVTNIKLSSILNMLNLITNTATNLQPLKLYSQKLNSGSVSYVTVARNPPLLCDAMYER